MFFIRFLNRLPECMSPLGAMSPKRVAHRVRVGDGGPGRLVRRARRGLHHRRAPLRNGAEGDITTGIDDGEFDYNVDEDDFNLDDNNDGDFNDLINASGFGGVEQRREAWRRRPP